MAVPSFALKVEDSTIITNNQMTASGTYKSSSNAPHAARLGTTTGSTWWSTYYLNKNQWLKIDLGNAKTITKLKIQKSGDGQSWVTKYKVSHSTNGSTFIFLNRVRFKQFSLVKLVKRL